MLEHPSIAAPASSQARPSYAGIWVPIVTPFLDDAARSVLAGEDAQAFGTLCLGGVGAIIASAHVRTAWFVEMARAIREQRLEDARCLNHALAPVIRLLFAATNPGPLKAWLAAEGLVRMCCGRR
ncbi:4-hydroxy-tetrahydrodipicolinate synthase [Ralstonia syzygii subsp. syzygii]|nr:4-hydroxy-tetrahydrodipicolinate synthase [Ralstonia syzygii subsp. syzygii]